MEVARSSNQERTERRPCHLGQASVSPILSSNGPNVLPRGPVKAGSLTPTSTFMATTLGHDGNGVGAAQDLPRGHIAQRHERCRIVLINVERDAAVEDRRVSAAVVMIGVAAKVEPRLRGNDSSKNIGIALDPRAGAVLSRSNLLRNRHHVKSEAKCAQHMRLPACVHISFPPDVDAPDFSPSLLCSSFAWRCVRSRRLYMRLDGMPICNNIADGS